MRAVPDGQCVTVSHRGCAHTLCASAGGCGVTPVRGCAGAVAPIAGAHRAAGTGPFGGYSRVAGSAGSQVRQGRLLTPHRSVPTGAAPGAAGGARRAGSARPGAEPPRPAPPRAAAGARHHRRHHRAPLRRRRWVSTRRHPTGTRHRPPAPRPGHRHSTARRGAGRGCIAPRRTGPGRAGLSRARAPAALHTRCRGVGGWVRSPSVPPPGCGLWVCAWPALVSQRLCSPRCHSCLHVCVCVCVTLCGACFCVPCPCVSPCPPCGVPRVRCSVLGTPPPAAGLLCFQGEPAGLGLSHTTRELHPKPLAGLAANHTAAGAGATGT